MSHLQNKNNILIVNRLEKGGIISTKYTKQRYTFLIKIAHNNRYIDSFQTNMSYLSNAFQFTNTLSPMKKGSYTKTMTCKGKCAFDEKGSIKVCTL